MTKTIICLSWLSGERSLLVSADMNIQIIISKDSVKIFSVVTNFSSWINNFVINVDASICIIMVTTGSSFRNLKHCMKLHFRFGLNPTNAPSFLSLCITCTESPLCSAQSWVLRTHARHHILLINKSGSDWPKSWIKYNYGGPARIGPGPSIIMIKPLWYGSIHSLQLTHRCGTRTPTGWFLCGPRKS